MKNVTIHSDGACQGNPGPGGWAAVLVSGPHRREIKGGALATTNNRMEIQAALEALKALNQPCEIELFTDSRYLVDGISRWVAGWKKRGWITQQKEPVKNVDLWRELDAQTAKHKVSWRWLKGHAGHRENERCDTLAVLEIEQLRRAHGPADLKRALTAFAASQKPRKTELLPL